MFRKIGGVKDYFVNKKGEVWSFKKRIWRKLKPFPVSKYGYLAVDLCCGAGSKRSVRLVHRLVLETFVGKCPDGMECRHLDSNPRNNKLTNIVWGTKLENARDQALRGTSRKGKRGLRGERHPMAKFTADHILEIRKFIKMGIQKKDIAFAYSTVSDYIRMIELKKVWKHL